MRTALLWSCASSLYGQNVTKGDGLMKVLGVCMGMVCCLGLTSAWAFEQASENILDKRLTLYGGAQAYQADGKFGFIEEGEPDVKVDLDDLGLDEDEVSIIAGGIINFGRKWTLRLDYFGYHDDGDQTAEFDFDFEDAHITVGAHIESSLDLDVYVANLSYNLIHTDQARFGVGLGVHLADIDIEVSGTATAGSIVTDLGTGKADVLAPLPNFYVTGAYSFTDRLLVRSSAGGMSMSYGDWDGSLIFANAFLEYWPFQNAGFGVGYKYLHADVDYDPGSKKETYDVKLPGPVFYVTAGF